MKLALRKEKEKGTLPHEGHYWDKRLEGPEKSEGQGACLKFKRPTSYIVFYLYYSIFFYFSMVFYCDFCWFNIYCDL